MGNVTATSFVGAITETDPVFTAWLDTEPLVDFVSPSGSYKFTGDNVFQNALQMKTCVIRPSFIPFAKVYMRKDFSGSGTWVDLTDIAADEDNSVFQYPPQGDGAGNSDLLFIGFPTAFYSLAV
jgi:hypothetical protein